MFAIKNWAKGRAIGRERDIISFDAGIDATVPVPRPSWGNATDDAGVKGQGNSPNPPSRFSTHFIIQVNDKFYDPSYALGPFTMQREYEVAAFDGKVWPETRTPVVGTPYVVHVLEYLPQASNTPNIITIWTTETLN